MGSLWTPGGERDVPAEPVASAQDALNDLERELAGDEELEDAELEDAALDDDDVAEAEAAMAAELDAARRRLADVPAEQVVANHAMGLFELAAIHLGAGPDHLADAALAIDALGALVEGLADRLGEAEPTLRDALSQIRLAFVQVKAAASP